MKTEIHPITRRRRRISAALPLIVWFLVISLASAQTTFTGKLKNFRLPDYYAPISPEQTNRVLRTLLSGGEAQQVSGSLVRITGLRIQSFREDGRAELDVVAAQCFLDLTTREATSDSHLNVQSASGFFSIEGDGFLWKQSNAVLYISNRVVTTLNRTMLADGAAATNAIAPPPPTAKATGDVVWITSDQCEFNNASNVVTQTGHVVVDDPQMQLMSDLVQARFAPNRQLERVVAEGNVRILNKSDESVATSGSAVYLLDPLRDVVTLKDNPQWRDRDGQQQVKATVFIYDRKARSLRGEGAAEMRIPRGALAQTWSFGPVGTPAPTGASAAGQPSSPVQINADLLTILLPATNRPSRLAVAENHVVILSPSDKLRATGDKAIYDEAPGRMELTGGAEWVVEDRVVRADRLTVDRTNRVFKASGNASFRLPLSQFLRNQSAGVSTNRPVSTNLFLDITAATIDYTSNTVVFREEVHTRFFEGVALRGLVKCQTLTAHLAERLDSFLAEKRVVAEHYPAPTGNGRVITNLLSCETLAAKVSASGAVVALVASENIQAAQIEARTNKARPTVTELTCEILTAVLVQQQGTVDKLHAERHVFITQEDRKARGDDAVYTAQANRIELTGQPFAEFAEGTVSNADVLIWDRTTGTFRGRGSKYRIEWKKSFRGGNQPLRVPLQ